MHEKAKPIAVFKMWSAEIFITMLSIQIFFLAHYFFILSFINLL